MVVLLSPNELEREDEGEQKQHSLTCKTRGNVLPFYNHVYILYDSVGLGLQCSYGTL